MLKTLSENNALRETNNVLVSPKHLLLLVSVLKDENLTDFLQKLQKEISFEYCVLEINKISEMYSPPFILFANVYPSILLDKHQTVQHICF